MRRLPVLLVVLTAGVLGGSAIATATEDAGTPVTWTGNGASDGTCDSNTANAALAPDTQSWQFNLTSPATGPWTLTATFSETGVTTTSGSQQGDGVVHFNVITSANDVLVSATATNGTASSVLTISHCDVNAVPGDVTTPGEQEEVSPTRFDVATPSGEIPSGGIPSGEAPSAVVAGAQTTG